MRVSFKIAWFVLAGALPLCGKPTNTAFMPENPPEFQPLASRDTPAHRAAKWFRRGVNLADYLEAPKATFNQWVSFDAGDFAQIRKEGFDHVRVPVGWHQYTGPAPEYVLSPEIFSRVDFVVTNALKNGLAVTVNNQHFDRLDENPTNALPEFLAIWRQVAEHYRRFPGNLAFDLHNEPHQNATTEMMNPIYALAIKMIRETNPKRTLVVEPGDWAGVDELKKLVLPPDDNVMVSVHCYEPFYFTHQGASWAGPDVRQTGIIFPGPPRMPLEINTNLDLKPWVRTWMQKYNDSPAEVNPCSPAAFADRLKYAHDWSEYYGHPVLLGEFGAIIKADAASRANYCSAVRQECEHLNIGWCIWDWSANFRYWDVEHKSPMFGMHKALFGSGP